MKRNNREAWKLLKKLERKSTPSRQQPKVKAQDIIINIIIYYNVHKQFLVDKIVVYTYTIYYIVQFNFVWIKIRANPVTMNN